MFDGRDRKVDPEKLIKMLQAGATRKQCAEHFGVHPGTIGQVVFRMRKNGVMDRFIKQHQESVNLAIAVIDGQTQNQHKQSDRVRTKLADEIESQIEILRATPAIRVGDLAGKDGRAALVKTITETASTLFDWSNTAMTGIIISGPLPEPPAQKSIIDVAPPEPEQKESPAVPQLSANGTGG